VFYKISEDNISLRMICLDALASAYD